MSHSLFTTIYTKIHRSLVSSPDGDRREMYRLTLCMVIMVTLMPLLSVIHQIVVVIFRSGQPEYNIPSSTWFEALGECSQVLWLLNGASKPIVYYLMCSKLKQSFRALITCECIETNNRGAYNVSSTDVYA